VLAMFGPFTIWRYASGRYRPEARPQILETARL